jgi:hypothetical protein
MKELIIYEFQAQAILDALKLTARIYDCGSKESCYDRDVMQSIRTMENVLAEKLEERVDRY